jgi:gluconolactonase
MTVDPSDSRRAFLKTMTGAAAACSAIAARGQDAPRQYGPGAPPARYPDPDIIALDPSFNALKLGNTPIQRVYHGTLWAEGAAWNGVGRYLIWSDIPRDEQLRFIEEDDHVSRRFRSPSGNSNGNTFDFQGRQISCLHKERQVIRYEYDGSVTVLADGYNGKSFNAPNDAVVHPNGDIWFTDPGYGSLMDYEGTNAKTGSVQPYQKEAVYRIEAATGKLIQMTDEVFKPNGICFSPDYKTLYVADTGGSHYKEATQCIRSWNVGPDAKLIRRKVFTTSELDGRAGGYDGIRCDVAGNVWSSAGWVGAGYDGVHVFNPEGARIGQIRLPEICSNVCFGGSKRNRLFMTASQSLYAVYVNIRGAHIT